MSVVPSLYQAYAAFPEFLQIHWLAFRPALQLAPFFDLGCRVAAESYTRAHNYFEIRPLCRPKPAAPVSGELSLPQVLDYYQYLDPLLLLIAAAQLRAFEEPVGQPARSSHSQAARHPEFALAPRLVRDEHAGPGLQRSWNERKRVLELAFVADEHRALARWPDFYVEYWAALKQLLQSPVYADCQYRLGESALAMAGELPVRAETDVSQLLEAGLGDEQITSVMRINEAFVQALTGLVLDITFARIGCEAAERAETTPHKSPATQSQDAGSPVRVA